MIRALRLLNLRRVRRQPLRSALTCLAVGAGVSIAVSVIVVVMSVERSFRDTGRGLAGRATLRVIGPVSRGGLGEAAITTVGRTPGVAAAVPMVQAVTYVRAAGQAPVPVLALGLDCRAEALVGDIGCSPAAVARADDAQPPLLSQRLARRLGGDGVIRTALGRRSLTGAPAAAQLDGLNQGRVTVFALAQAQRLFARAGEVDTVFVVPDKDAPTSALRSRLARALPPWDAVLPASAPPPSAKVVLSGSLPLFTLLAVFALGVGGVLVFNTVALSLAERRRQLAVVAALGGTARVVAGGALLEAAVLGAAGGVLGGTAGFVIAGPIVSSLSAFTERFVGVPLTVHRSAGPVAAGAALGAVVAVLGAWRPARRALRLDIAAELSSRELREEAAPARVLRRAVVLVGVGLVATGLCWLGARNGALQRWQPPVALAAFPVAGTAYVVATGAWAAVVIGVAVRRVGPRAEPRLWLSLANLARDPGRTGVMAVAIASSVGIALIVASFIVAIRHNVDSEVARTVGGRVRVSVAAPTETLNVDARLPGEVVERLRRLPGVADVVRGADVLTGTSARGLVGVTASDHPVLARTLFRGTRSLARLQRGEVMIGAGLARAGHVGPGSRLVLQSPRGPARLRVQGIWNDGNYNGRSVTMTLDRLAAIWGAPPPVEVYVRPAPGMTGPELARRIRAAHLDPDLHVQTPQQFAALISEDIAGQLQAFWTLQRALMLVAFVAVLSTLLLVGAQRRREMALLAAIGLPPRGLAQMVLGEGAVIGIASIALGLLGGVGMFEAGREILPILIGFHDPFRLDLLAVPVYAALGLLLVLAAATLPAWRASRLEVVEALQYE